MLHTELPEQPWGPAGYAGPLPQKVADVKFAAITSTPIMNSFDAMMSNLANQIEGGCERC